MAFACMKNEKRWVLFVGFVLLGSTIVFFRLPKSFFLVFINGCRERWGLCRIYWCSEISQSGFVPDGDIQSEDRDSWKHFQSFFIDEKVEHFTKMYRASCRLRNFDRSISTIFLGSKSFGGFGSALNNALNIFVFAATPGIQRTFRIINYNWSYTDMSDLLADFASHTLCPIYRTETNRERSFLLKNKFSVASSTNYSFPIRLTAPDDLYITYHGPDHYQPLDKIKHAIRHLTNLIGFGEVFRRKSLIARSLWNPVPELKRLIFVFWKAATRFGCYDALHLRKGDKLATHEMRNISAEMYRKSVIDVCREQGKLCCRNLFVVHDDRRLYHQFYRMVKKDFRVFDLAVLADVTNLSREDLVVELNGLNVHDALGKNESLWHIHTREIVISVTLLALANHVLCTFSSNFCRIGALLRSERYGSHTLHSLDTSWHKTIE